ncbi:MAG: hypothetical protein ABIV21_09255 [Pyrinomonadaceae bacterium]
MKRYWPFMFTFALVFYGLGAGFVESFVNYRTWYFIGPDQFRAYHHALSPLIIAFLVVPVFSMSLFILAMFWLRPPAIPRWSVAISFILAVSIIIISVTVQIPIQQQLSQNGLSTDLLDKLILTDWIRKVLAIINAGLFMWMMSRVLKSGAENVADKH